jgi:maltose/moltooligosaccharide transporter
LKKGFPYGRTLLLGFGFLGISIIGPIFNQFIPIFLQAGNPEFERQLLEAGRELPTVTGFGLSPALAFFVMTWDNILNVFISPWAGERSDRTWNRFGRRKPYILLGAPLALLGFVFIPVAQSILAVMAFILITNFGMALFRSPTLAWLGDLFEPDERSKASGVINTLGGVGGLLAFFGGGYLFNFFGRESPFFAGAAAIALVLVVVLLFVKEPLNIQSEEAAAGGVLNTVKIMFSNPDKSGLFVWASVFFWFMGFNALDTALSSFAVFSLGISPGTASIYAGAVTVSFILFAIPAGLMGTRYGRRLPIRLGLIGLTLLLVGGYFLIEGEVVFVIVLVLAGFCWALVNVNSLPLFYDYSNRSNIGAYAGLYYFAAQLASVLGPTLGGGFVELMGSNYRFMWLFSTLFMALAFLIMTQVKALRTVMAPTPAAP